VNQNPLRPAMKLDLQAPHPSRALAEQLHASVRQAIHGDPPSYNQRLGYRSWKKRRARQRIIEEYGDPAAPNPTALR
jgi:hypothetical protein